MSIAPRAILITGANRGLGLEFVRQIVRFSTPPKYLFATCRNPESATSLQEMAKEHSCIKVMKFDVCDFSSYNNLKEKISSMLEGEGLNSVVCNAGVNLRTGFVETTPELMTSVYTTNVIAPLTLAQVNQAKRRKLRQAKKIQWICNHWEIFRDVAIGIFSDRNFCFPERPEDVTDHREIQAVCDRTRHLLAEDGLNLIVNNAGITYKKQYLGNLTHSQILEQFDVNVFSPLLITQTFMPLLKLAAQKFPEESMSWRKAAVVNISSILGSIEKNENGGLYPYRASKAALNMVTKTQSIDLKADGILTVVVHPGWVQTDMGGQSAPVTPTESLKGMLSLFSKLTEDSSGKFFDFNGKILPW